MKKQVSKNPSPLISQTVTFMMRGAEILIYESMCACLRVHEHVWKYLLCVCVCVGGCKHVRTVCIYVLCVRVCVCRCKCVMNISHLCFLCVGD